MTRAETLWSAIRKGMSTTRWTPLQIIYRCVEESINLDAEDQLPEAPGSTGPKWKRNVRNVLQRRRTTGEVSWNGSAEYRRSA